MTPSYRHRNPGNLRWGKRKIGSATDGFAEYATLSDGFADLIEWLDNAARGANPHGLTAQSSIAAMIEVYAPEADHNQPTAYANFIAGWVSRVMNVRVEALDPIGKVFTMQSASDLLLTAPTPKG